MSTWKSLTTVVIPRSRCPFCDCLKPPHLIRSVASGDGSVTRLAICRSCSKKYLIAIDVDAEPVVIQPLES